MSPKTAQFVVFKGGSAFNSVLQEFQARFPQTSYIVPITDDGGSSREISRVFGGPSIGDLRSTLTRLSDESTLEACSVKKLLEHRLSLINQDHALAEWHQFLESTHPLLEPISTKYRNLIRCFLCKFDSERLIQINQKLDLRNGSLGNFFLTGARMLLGSLETAIFLYSSIAKIPSSTQVIPIIDSNERLGIGVQLKDKSIILGQNSISHPEGKKNNYTPLSAPIESLFYIDKFQNVINPMPNSEVLEAIKNSEAIVYGMGSCWTSIIPSLVLKPIGETIASKKCPKILLLNSCQDRETHQMTGLNYLQNIVSSLNRYGELQHSISDYITHVMVVEGCSIAPDENELSKQKIKVMKIKKDPERETHLFPFFDQEDLVEAIANVASNEQYNV